MKIYFRYLFIRLLIPFAVCLFAGTLIWVMANLYGNINNFLDHKADWRLILWFYTLQIPTMLVQVLPAAMLFSALWTLLGLNRRSELVAFQSGGMSPLWLFSPFFLFAAIWVIILGIDLAGPAPQSQVTSERILQEIKGQDARDSVFHNLPYVDNVNRLVWFFQTLDIKNSKAKDVEILFLDAQGRDVKKYFAHEAAFNGNFWKLSGVREILYGSETTVKDFAQVDLSDITTPPKQLSLVASQPDQLTVAQLSQYIATSTSTPDHLAGYRTEWWYRVLHPFSLIVLLLFALLNGMHTDRRGAATGVAWTIGVLVLYVFSMAMWMPFGQHNRLPPFIAAVATEVIFGCIGVHLLAMKYGWYWQIRHWGNRIEAAKHVGWLGRFQVMRLILGFLFLLAPGCVFGWEAYKTDVSQKSSAEVTDELDHLEPVDRKMLESPYLVEFVRQPALGYQYLHLTLSRDEASGKFYLHAWSEWRKETEARPLNEVLGPSTKVEFPVDLASRVYSMWVNALLEVHYDRKAHTGVDGWTDLFSAYIKGRGYLHGATWSPTKDLPPKWLEGAALALVQYTKDKDDVACRKKLTDLRDELFAYLAANGKH